MRTESADTNEVSDLLMTNYDFYDIELSRKSDIGCIMGVRIAFDLRLCRQR